MWLWRSWLGIPVIILQLKSVLGLYEDELGLNDWHMPLIGRAEIVVPGGLSTACLSTNKAVIACLNVSPDRSLESEGGGSELLWRAVLNVDDSVQALAFEGSDLDGRLLSVSGDRSVARLWDSRSGSLLWETPVMEGATATDGESRKVAALLGGPRGHAIVTVGNRVICLNSKNGAILWSWSDDESLKLTDIKPLEKVENSRGYVVAGFTTEHETGRVSMVAIQLSIDGAKVAVNSTKLGEGPPALKYGNGIFFTTTQGSDNGGEFHWLACALLPSGKKLLTLDVETGSAAEVHLGCSELVTKVWPLFNGGDRLIGVRHGQNGRDVEYPALLVDGKVKNVGEKRLKCVHSPESGACRAGVIFSYDLENLLPQDHTVVGRERGGLDALFSFPDASSTLSLFEDDSLILSSERRVLWTREEALSSVVSAAIFDMEAEESSTAPIDHHMPSYFTRLSMHAERGAEFLGGLLKSNGKSIASSPLSKGDLNFGLGKLAVIGTKSGKLCGLNLVTGTLAWSRMEPCSKTGAIYATRSKPVLGYETEFALLSKSPEGVNVMWADASTGQKSRGEMVKDGVRAFPINLFGAEDRQIVLVVKSDGGVIPVPDSQHIRELITDNLPHVFDHSIDDMGVMSYAIEAQTTKDIHMSSTPFVSSLIGSANWGESSRVVCVAHVNPLEVVPLPAHILGDDSLLLKYINRHLVVVATLSASATENAVGGRLLTVTIIDSVNAKVLHRITHEAAAGPVHAVVYENNVVYSYWNSVGKRTEIGSVSLYEGLIQTYHLSPWGEKQEWHPSFSSFDSHTPIALQKTYIFPHVINGMSVTMTANGISPKQVLLALNNGQVAVLDRNLLDPRRPEREPTKMESEEKLIKYTPYLPNIRTIMPTYNICVERILHMATRPSHLESTTILLAWGGLDVFSGRVVPSTRFDVLAPDFSYGLLVVVLIVLAICTFGLSSYVTHKRLVSQWA